MLLSRAEHEELIRRVERLVRHRGVERSVIAGVVDRVLGKLATSSVELETTTHTVVVMAESMPDVASRLRGALDPHVSLRDASVASEGRHYVLAARVTARDVPAVTDAASRLGLRTVVREHVGAPR